MCVCKTDKERKEGTDIFESEKSDIHKFNGTCIFVNSFWYCIYGRTYP